MGLSFYVGRRQSRGRVFLPPSVCMSGFSHCISKTDADKITKLDVNMFHDES